MQIITGKIPGAIKCCLYGPEGIGKSTFASQWPDPLFIDTEDSTVHMDVKRLPKPEHWTELLNEVNWVYSNPTCCKTLVLDTADWAERLCIEFVCSEKKVDSLEAFPYGKGYVFVQEQFGYLLDKLENVRKKGIHILIIAHSKLQKFEQPDELGAYDRWSMKLTKQVGPMLREWCDALLFANYKTIVVNVDNKGAAKGKNKVQGGKRVMYTAHNACYDAKNRFGLPEEMDFGYDGIREVIEGAGTTPRTSTATPHPSATPTPSPQGEGKGNGKGNGDGLDGSAQTAREPTETAQEAAGAPQTPLESAATNSPPDGQTPPGAASAADAGPEYAGLPAPVARMMHEAQVMPDEVRHVIAQKGIYPANTPWSTICENEQFVKGWLMHPNVWPKVVNAVKENRETEEVPF